MKCCFWFSFLCTLPYPFPHGTCFLVLELIYWIPGSRVNPYPGSAPCSMEGKWTLFPLYSCPAITIHHVPSMSLTFMWRNLVNNKSELVLTTEQARRLNCCTCVSLSSATVAVASDILSTTVGIDCTCLDGSNTCMYTILLIPNAWKLNQSISSITPNSKGAMIWSWCA